MREISTHSGSAMEADTLPDQVAQGDLDPRLLHSGFFRSARTWPHRSALEVSGQTLTYQQLDRIARSLAATIQKCVPSTKPPLTCVFAYRSVTAFAGILGALYSGQGYVPLNRTFPVHRTLEMLTRSGARSLIVDRDSEPQLEEILARVTNNLLIILPEQPETGELRKRWPTHTIIGQKDLEAPEACVLAEPEEKAIAYLLFTSGSTGTPKGVMVSHANVRHYVDWTVRRYEINETDRVSQNFDMTFDLSVHDMFVAWERGASVCCPTQKQLFKPNAFIKDARLTTWFSVPSTAMFMKKLGVLKPGMYPGLRLSLFCGEALPAQTIIDWAAAAPNSTVENIYGPTELTIACTAYRWDTQRSPAECEQEVVPIGAPFDEMDMLIVDEHLHHVPPGHDGELLMTGPQLSLGYWEDEEKTRRAFTIPPGETRTFYRTGDRVRRAAPDAPIVYLGRMDNQVKIFGHRVELGEIEACIRDTTGIQGVVALGWPMTSSGADGIEAFVQTDALDAKAVLDVLRTKLPAYMVPKNIRAVPHFPLNANGKFDRRALQQLIETTI